MTTTPSEQPAIPASAGGAEKFVAGPVWREEEEESECWTAEVQTLGGYYVVATVHGGSRDEAIARRDAIIAALCPVEQPALFAVLGHSHHSADDPPYAGPVAISGEEAIEAWLGMAIRNGEIEAECRRGADVLRDQAIGTAVSLYGGDETVALVRLYTIARHEAWAEGVV